MSTTNYQNMKKQDLLIEHKKLILENRLLRNELNSLKEGTIVQSMNDMMKSTRELKDSLYNCNKDRSRLIRRLEQIVKMNSLLKDLIEYDFSDIDHEVVEIEI